MGGYLGMKWRAQVLVFVRRDFRVKYSFAGGNKILMSKLFDVVNLLTFRVERNFCQSLVK